MACECVHVLTRKNIQKIKNRVALKLKKKRKEHKPVYRVAVQTEISDDGYK